MTDPAPDPASTTTPVAGDDDETESFGATGTDLAMVHDPQRGWLHFVALPAPGGMTGKGMRLAIVDTGLVAEHPDLAPRIVEQVDFTGEGPEDGNGHGTIVGLIALRQSPEADLVNVKALRADGKGRVGPLRAALNWLATRPDIRVVNLSAGVYRPACTGHCTVCEAARRLWAAGTVLVVAAGNIPGLQACPAKAEDAVIAVAALDPTSGRLWPTTSPAGEQGLSAPTPEPGSAYWS